MLRGKWVLENLLGAPPPPPPPDVPALEEDERRRAPRRRCASRWSSTARNPVCASCHKVMDPIGFALENFDAVGAWRTTNEAGVPLEPPTCWPTATKIDGVVGAAAGAAQAARRVRADADRKAADLRARPRPDRRGHAGGAAIVRDARAAATTGSRRSSGHRRTACRFRCG